ncbi:MAG: hypothetical protein R3C39_07335 [Dehalococcoidia bacterium]
MRWVLGLALSIAAVALVATRGEGPRVVDGGTAAWNVRYETPSNWGQGPFERWMPTSGLAAADGSMRAWMLVLPVASTAAIPAEWDSEDLGPVRAAGLDGRMVQLRHPGGQSAFRAYLDDPMGTGWVWRVELRGMPDNEVDALRPAFDLALRTLAIEWR